MRERRRTALLALSGLLAIAVLMTTVWACDMGAPSCGANLTFEEVVDRIETLEPGDAFEFYLRDLTPEAQMQYLDYIGRPDDDPSNYAEALITYDLAVSNIDAARGSTYCLRRTEQIAHSSKCQKAKIVSKSGSCWYPYGDGCRHDGYTMNRSGREVVESCTYPGCPFCRRVQTWTHSPE